MPPPRRQDCQFRLLMRGLLAVLLWLVIVFSLVLFLRALCVGHPGATLERPPNLHPLNYRD